jgi:protein required for attachment to host cells
MKNWVVVANASRARVLEESGPVGVYEHVADLVHPQSRQKAGDLADDRPGHFPGPAAHGTGSSAFEPRTSPRVREHDRFASELAALLDEGIADGRCAGLVVVASNPFLGLLTEHLGDRARKAILRSVASDYTALSEQELGQRIGLLHGA